MNKFNELTRFIPTLKADMIGEWVYDGETTRIEYWDVVFRFCDAVEAFCEKNPEYGEFAAPDSDRAHHIVAKLLHAVREEPVTPGLLYGYITNGTVREWLTELEDS
ncbi:MAG: hypothetical protein K6F68_06765 [Clostridiales bacterium]|nr:hypothetical protein [Clostridiales bacterium]